MNKFLLSLTHKIWRPLTSRTLSIAYERGIIDSNALHAIDAVFDKTQKSTFANPSYLLKRR